MSHAAVTHCVHMLDYLAGSAAGATAAEAADQLDVSAARAQMVLDALVERGYAGTTGAEAERYRLTMKLTKLGLAYQAHGRASDMFQAILDRVAERTGELVRMALADGNRLRWVAKAQGSRSGLRFDAEPGRDVALASTAAGKAWLARLPGERAATLVRAQGFPAKNEFGPRAIRSAAQLARELKTVAQRGHAVGHDEYLLGISAIAAAIVGRSPDEPPIGVVSIAGPSTRLNAGKLDSFRAPLLAATAELAVLLAVLGESSKELLK